MSNEGYQHNFALINQQRLHYLSAGDPEAETIVLLAGFPQSSFAWRFVISQLATKFHVIAPDLPGQGIPICPRAATIPTLLHSK